MLAGPVSVQPWEDDERERQTEQEDYRNAKIEGGKDRDCVPGRWMERWRERDARGKKTI